MTQPLNRDEIIALLDRLGGGDDADVLDAARSLHARLAEAGATWSDLLAPEDSGGDTGADAEAEADEPADTGADEGADTGAEAEADTGAEAEADEPAKAEADMPADKAGRNAESLALIKKLLARPGISDTFRRDMELYKTDIAEGDFTDADHKYLRALDKRLSG